MALELWWGSGSSPARRVQLALALKGVAYEGHLVSFSNRDTRKPEFLALNPRGEVPTVRSAGGRLAGGAQPPQPEGVRSGAFTLYESLAILAWLDREHPEPPLFGRTPEETGLVWRWCLECENHAAETFRAVGGPIAFGRAEAEGDAVRAAIPALHEELGRFARAVDGGQPLVGGALSAADLVWYAEISFLVRAATRPAAAAFELGLLPFAERWPAILAWGRRVEAIPGFDATVPPHWLEGVSPYPPRWA